MRSKPKASRIKNKEQKSMKSKTEKQQRKKSMKTKTMSLKRSVKLIVLQPVQARRNPRTIRTDTE